MNPIKQTHHSQNPVNIALLNFVAKHGSASWLELFEKFGDGDASSKTIRQRFSKKLEYLVFVEKLQASGRGTTRTFCLGTMADKPTPGRGRITTHAGQADGFTPRAARPTVSQESQAVPAYVASGYGQRVPPRRINTMAAPPYQPPAHTSTRPGSLDYQRYASHGDRC